MDRKKPEQLTGITPEFCELKRSKLVSRVNMPGHTNFIFKMKLALLKGAWVGANDSSKALSFVVLSPVALSTILGNLYNRKIARK